MRFQSIAPDVKLGKNVKIYDFVNLHSCEIGDNSKIGTFVEIQKVVKIGKNCKISTHAFVCEGVTIEDNVFIGHHVAFINDLYPRATTDKDKPKTDADWKVIPTFVMRGASIGSGDVILSNVTIGEFPIVGAGSVVVRDVNSYSVVAGNPARLIRQLEVK